MMKKTLFQRHKDLSLKALLGLIFLLGTFSLYAQDQSVSGQKITITGVINDDSGEPLIGATITEKGTANATLTDPDGRFTINVTDKKAVLNVSYIGFVAKQITVGNNTDLQIVLSEDGNTLEAVVVVGYGVQKKATLTGAVVAVSNADILTTKNENVQNMLTGKLPGVRVVQKTSEPGSFSNSFDIRGMGNPLVVVDGVPRDNFTRMDANDIESISVLKDGSAAVYGVRAANGVVLITTKKGKKGTLDLEYSGNVGWQHPTGSPKSVNAADWMMLKNEKNMHNANGGLPTYSQAEIDAYRNGTMKSTDWWDECMRSYAPQTQHSVSATGGTEQVSFYISGGYMNQESFLRSNNLNYEKFNVRSNISAKISNRLTVDLNIDGIMDKKNQPYYNADWIIRSFQRAPAIQNPYANNNPDYLALGMIEGENPKAMMNSDVAGSKQFKNKWFQSSVAFTYDVPYIDGLTAKMMYSYDFQTTNNKIYKREHQLYEYDKATEVYKSHGRESPGSFRKENYTKQSTLYNFSLNYNRTFNKVHNVNVLALVEGSRRTGDNFYAQRETVLDLDQLFPGSSKNQQANSNTGYDPEDPAKQDLFETTNMGIVGKFAYDYASKYLVEFNFRQDASSKFRSGSHQWGFFPSVSAGWRISEEDFWKSSSLSFIENLKLRASYGKMGDDRSSRFQYVSGYDYPDGGYFFDGTYVNASKNRGLVNPNITWYTVKTYDVGVDLDAWSGLFGFSFDYFIRNRDGLLARRSGSLPGVVGADLPEENLNGDRLAGYELELRHTNKIEDFSYNIKAMLSYTRLKNRHQEGNDIRSSSYDNWRNNNGNRYQNVHWGYTDGGRFTSYDQIANSNVYYDRHKLPGDYIYEDWNGDGVIDDLDVHPFTYQDSKAPFFNYSFNIGAEWRNFDLNALFQGSALADVRYEEQLREPMWGHDYANALEYFKNRWRPTNPTVDPYDHTTQWISGKYAYTNTHPDANSEFNMHNASYIRLKSLELGYTLPTKLVTRIGLKNARVYVNAYNLFTIKNVELDPEHKNENYGNTYPLSQTYTVGVNVKF